jgi:hypothetical protein
MSNARHTRPRVVTAAIVVNVASAVVLLVFAFVGAALLVIGTGIGG